MNSGTPRSALTVRQIGLVGASLGLIIGLYEAARLYSIPSGPLLEPDVGYMVWLWRRWSMGRSGLSQDCWPAG